MTGKFSGEVGAVHYQTIHSFLWQLFLQFATRRVDSRWTIAGILPDNMLASLREEFRRLKRFPGGALTVPLACRVYALGKRPYKTKFRESSQNFLSRAKQAGSGASCCRPIVTQPGETFQCAVQLLSQTGWLAATRRRLAAQQI